MPIQEKQLGQLRPADMTAASLYSPAAGVTGVIKSIVICNQTSGAVTFRIFVDDDGTTYDETTAHYFDTTLAANTTRQIDTFWPMNNSSGNLAVRTNTNDAITFTAYGVEIT